MWTFYVGISFLAFHDLSLICKKAVCAFCAYGKDGWKRPSYLFWGPPAGMWWRWDSSLRPACPKGFLPLTALCLSGRYSPWVLMLLWAEKLFLVIIRGTSFLHSLFAIHLGFFFFPDKRREKRSCFSVTVDQEPDLLLAWLGRCFGDQKSWPLHPAVLSVSCSASLSIKMQNSRSLSSLQGKGNCWAWSLLMLQKPWWHPGGS